MLHLECMQNRTAHILMPILQRSMFALCCIQDGAIAEENRDAAGLNHCPTAYSRQKDSHLEDAGSAAGITIRFDWHGVVANAICHHSTEL